MCFPYLNKLIKLNSISNNSLILTLFESSTSFDAILLLSIIQLESDTKSNE